ncbi:hypothetical protein B0H13DRAFT_2325022 [Mycena leptocephala]|nr:hypothetical protein B0H13DRAFT_2325022 [Mycena leptocephala]
MSYGTGTAPVARVPSNLARPSAPSREDTAYDPEKSDPLPSDPTVTPPSPSSTPEYTEILDYATGTTKRVPMQVSPVADMFSALPTHEYCTPTARNISHDEDPHDMLFVPFADDPTFDHARYLKAYQDFSWRTSALDPDLEVVVVETAHRLRTEHQMLYQHIDETGVLPLELLDRDGSQRMKDLTGTPCGGDCFLLKSVGDDAIEWSDNDFQFLRTILGFSPDTLPCDLGTV